MNKNSYDVLGDLFPYLTDMIVDDEEVCVESIIDALYGYGTLHGHTLQTKVEQSPFYTKHYKKITVKQQQQLRAVKETPPGSEEDVSSEEEQKKLPSPSQKGRGKHKKTLSKENPSTSASDLSKTYVGVTSRGISASFKDPTKGSSFESTIIIGQRKVNVGHFSSAKEAAHAYDRALIRANGPSNCQEEGVLNFPLSQYSGDSLSKFSAFDGVLKKQLFGSDWSGPKACDFGFLMTQPGPSSATKRCADVPGMGPSMRRKRHKGQYGDSGGSGSGAYPRGPRFENGKRLLHGNYYMILDEPGDDDIEEPYFKSSGSQQRRAAKSIARKQPADPNQALVGDILVVMHGDKERKAGRPSHERGVLLERTAFGGWLVIGFSDHTHRNLRGDQVNILGACDATMKFMKVPVEAVVADDVALREYFASAGMLSLAPGQRLQVAMPPTHSTSVPASATATTTMVASSTKLEAGEFCLPSANNPYSAPRKVVSSSPISSTYSHLGIEQEYVKLGVERYYTHYDAENIMSLISEMNFNTADKDEDDPVSLYELAAYGRGLSSVGADSGAEVALANSAKALQDSDLFVRGRSSRNFLINSGICQQGNRPPNFQVFSSGTFGHKMTDLLAGSCFVLPQEIMLIRAILDNILTSKESSNDHTNADSDAAVPQPRWLLSLLDPTSTESGVTLRSLRQTIAEVLTSTGSTTQSAVQHQQQSSKPSDTDLQVTEPSTDAAAAAAESCSTTSSSTVIAGASAAPVAISESVQALARRLLSDCKYEGVSNAMYSHHISTNTNTAASGNSDSNSSSSNDNRGMGMGMGRFTFDLPADNKMLMADLGISPAIISAALQSSSLSSSDPADGQQHQQSGKGSVVVGYFSSALEAAMVREQVLGLTKSIFGVNNSYRVDEARNFNAEEWTELRRLGKLISKFTRKQCMP